MSSEKVPNNDLVHNVELYLEVPSIEEYWILNPRPDPDQPSLRVNRRRGANWQKPIDVPYGIDERENAHHRSRPPVVTGGLAVPPQRR